MVDPFKALASNTRRRILNHLSMGPMNAGQIAEQFDMAKPSISKHLSVLREAGLISEEKQGQFVIYSLVEDNLTNALYDFLSRFCPEARRIKGRKQTQE
ncbi:metalloregulator ArsR/SmtB family transcription factor [Pseudomonas sp. CAU 1711]|uniref:metalloregulator ArsR/SmtB family transcription factor n=1 Tax=Pseudomonas sp. CAU 1711 TaxID=3140356 RepID=UPI0032614196